MLGASVETISVALTAGSLVCGLLIIFNPWQDMVKFKLPAAAGGSAWTLRADTNFPDATEDPQFAIGHEYEVTARSLLLFQLT